MGDWKILKARLSEYGALWLASFLLVLAGRRSPPSPWGST
jgi:hypothetical protein